MSYTVRQVRALLTKPELELFEASRAAALKELTLRQAAGKVTRARHLRDKFRDLYRRQTAEAQRRPAKDRNPIGDENDRTQQKADIFAEALARFEQQHGKLMAQAERAKAKASAGTGSNGSGAPAKKAKSASGRGARKTSDGRVAARGATIPMRGVAGTKPREIARKNRAATAQGLEMVEQRARAKAAAKKAATRAPVPSAAGQPGASGAKAGKKKNAGPVVAAQAAGARASSGRVAVGATKVARGGASTGIEARAQRVNVLKEKPINQKIHASQRGRSKAYQAKRDQ